MSCTKSLVSCQGFCASCTQNACFQKILCIMHPKCLFFPKYFVHHAPKVFVFPRILSVSAYMVAHMHLWMLHTQYSIPIVSLEGSVGAFSKKNRRRKRLVTPLVNWSTCNFQKIKFEQNKNCNCNCNLNNIFGGKTKNMYVNISVQIVKTDPPLPGASDSPFPLPDQKQIKNIRNIHQVK